MSLRIQDQLYLGLIAGLIAGGIAGLLWLTEAFG